jgi:hypothetical protein
MQHKSPSSVKRGCERGLWDGVEALALKKEMWGCARHDRKGWCKLPIVKCTGAKNKGTAMPNV